MDPYVCVYDQRSKEIVSQVFNFIDTLGGKQAINPESIEKFLTMRGILKPSANGLEAITSNKKDAEVYEYSTKIAECAGDAFSLDKTVLADANERLEEMDRVEVIELD